MAHEIELKLSIDSSNIPRFRRYMRTVYGVSKPSNYKLITVYYDTPDLKLLEAGVALRIRSVSGRWIQSIKAVGIAIGGLHQRMEWEYPIATDQPDYSKITDLELIKFLDDQEIRSALKPIFKTIVQRSEYQLTLDHDNQVELVIDKGELVTDGLKTPISEIELELKAGHVGCLFNLALEIQKAMPVTIENHNKAELGYNHYRAPNYQTLQAKSPTLNKNLNSFDAFKKIAWECIHHLQGNQDIVMHTADAEGVHQMRVAIRRLRSAFSVFKSIIDNEYGSSIIHDLKWLASTLGKARDLDVFILDTIPDISAHSGHAEGIKQLGDLALSAQEKAYQEVRSALTSQRYQRMILTLSACLENRLLNQNIGKTKHTKIMTLASKRLNKHYLQLLKTGCLLEKLHPTERHAVRIYAKKLRYSTEFFASLYSKNQSQAFINCLSKLQDILGSLNDISNTEILLTDLINGNQDPALDQVLDMTKAWGNSNTTHQLKKINKAWREFSNQKPFWR